MSPTARSKPAAKPAAKPTAKPAAKPAAKPTAKPAAKPKLAIFGAASCGGCDIAIVNIHEHILEVAAAFDIVLWPTVMDGKYSDIEAMEDGEITITLVSGSMRTDETVHLSKLLRRKSKFMVAFGSCASEGCIPGLANLTPRKEILDTAFSTSSTDNPDGIRPVWEFEAPEGILHLPEFEPMLRTLDQVVDVDYTIPGCPPESEQIWAALQAVVAALKGTGPLPPKGSILGAGESTVCDECARKRDVKKIDRFVRIQQVAAFDPEICLLEQGLPCNGPATRNGCGALCPSVSAPCIGCYGAAEGVVDYGARLMSAYASVIEATKPEEIDKILDGIPDPAGQFYRFSLAGSLLRGSRSAWQSDGE
jgi:F420-non-reducing hydrogenase small subunit